jgi:hypothetical protein
MFNLNKVDIRTKESSKVGKEVVTGFTEVGEGLIIGFERSVRIRRPEMKTTVVHRGDRVEIVDVGGAINGGETEEGLNVPDEVRIGAASHTR